MLIRHSKKENFSSIGFVHFSDMGKKDHGDINQNFVKSEMIQKWIYSPISCDVKMTYGDQSWDS